MTALETLGSILKFATSARDALKEKGLSKTDLDALSALFGAGDSLLKLKNPKDEDKQLGAIHLAIVARCFGHAVRQLPDAMQSIFQSITQAEQPSRPTDKKISKILEDAAKAWLAPGQMSAGKAEFELVESLTGNPLATPFYRFLWDALTASTHAEPPLLSLQPGERIRFESAFLLAWGQAMTLEIGEQLRHHLDSLRKDYKPELLKQLLISDMADWGNRHTFGNISKSTPRDGDPLPFMPLEEVYVEPSARVDFSNEVGPVLKLLQRLLHKHTVIVVQADFGTGKSLTARTLAFQLANEFKNSLKSSPDLVLPVYIRSADDLKPQDLSFEKIVRHALRRHASTLGYSLKLSDPSLNTPTDRQHVLFLIDGLDEVHLGEKGLAELFENIKSEATTHHRFVIFSRPGALPSRRNVRELENVPFLELLCWDNQQVEDWLGRWKKISAGQGPTRQEIKDKGLEELAKTPILLLMIAHTWSLSTSGRHINKAELYEMFFSSIARGKHESDRDTHPAVFEASVKLKELLVSKKILTQEAEPADAMLWLMSRVAWEAVRLEHRGLVPLLQSDNLTKGEIKNLLDKELGFRNEATATIESIQVGLLLALQANLHADNASQILFGHKSFREFLVARYWADRLKALCRDDIEPEDKEDIERSLLGGRLLGNEDQSFSFLMDILNSEEGSLRLESRERDEIIRWLEARYRDEKWLGGNSTIRLRDDQSALLREAALAIGSCLSNGRGLKQRDPLTLKSLFAWFWLADVNPIIIAPRASLEDAKLAGLSLLNANLEGANLKDADCRSANLHGANLQDANLEGAILVGASLGSANLRNANLHQVDLSYAHMNNANLREADLEDAFLQGAELEGANLARSNLEGARMHRVTLQKANIEQANLREAHITEANLHRAVLVASVLQLAVLERTSFEAANLRDADLQGTELQGANFRGANLQGADFRSANLQGADFRGAYLQGAKFVGARYNRETVWPDPEPNLVGAVFSEDEDFENNEDVAPDVSNDDD